MPRRETTSIQDSHAWLTVDVFSGRAGVRRNVHALYLVFDSGFSNSMSDLTHLEKRRLEKLFQMSSGYVLEFSNSTFQDFITDTTGKNIYDNQYDSGSGSKANRLRKFWHVEPNYIVAKVLRQLLHIAAEKIDPNDQEGGVLWRDCERIVMRMEQSAPVPELEAINPNTAERDFAALAKAAREAIERNEPESGIDRLHTFLVRYLRVVCEQHGRQVPPDRPLHSLMGDYIKLLRAQSRLESDMTERLLKYSISTLEGFNWVRNNHSFAHPCSLLSYEESLFIYNHITALIRFIESIERRGRKEPCESTHQVDDEIPF